MQCAPTYGLSPSEITPKPTKPASLPETGFIAAYSEKPYTIEVPLLRAFIIVAMMPFLVMVRRVLVAILRVT